MIYLLSEFWLFLLLAFLLGGMMAWMEGGARCCRCWLWWGALAIGVVVAGLMWLPGRLGFWFEVGVLMLGSYMLGHWITHFVRSRNGEEGKTPLPMPAERAVEPALAPLPVGTVVEEAPIVGLAAPIDGKADDLTEITGVSTEIAHKLNAMGLYHYSQIAAHTPAQNRWLFRQLGLADRFPDHWWRWRDDAQALAVAAKEAGGVATPEIGGKEAKEVSATKSEGVSLEDAARPAALAAPRGGKADDLKRIKGIGKQNEGRLHGLGIWHFEQIAAWSQQEVDWVGAYLAFPGRIEREQWVAQAKTLAAGGETDFSKRADKGEVATSRDDSGDDGQGNIEKLDKPLR